MSISPFQFKKFRIHQDRCAMKVGTDGILLGAWATLKHKPFSVLDIGTGTGLIALQLAQRSDAHLIDAIEIESNAYEQAVENFEISPWNDRLFCYHVSLKNFVEEIHDTYDLIVSNPPFYTDDFKSGNIARNTARNTIALSFEELVSSVVKLLATHGKFSTIIPFKEEAFFIALAKQNNLFINTVCRVKGTPTSEFKRTLLEFSFQKTTPQITTLIIETERHEYTSEYKSLVNSFYLKI